MEVKMEYDDSDKKLMIDYLNWRYKKNEDGLPFRFGESNTIYCGRQFVCYCDDILMKELRKR